jgi:hypothetical protein
VPSFLSQNKVLYKPLEIKEAEIKINVLDYVKFLKSAKSGNAACSK